MKKVLEYLPLLVIAILLWSGCEKEKTVLPPREMSEEVSTIADRYNKILLAATDGWVLAYKPEQATDSTYIAMRFAEGLKVKMQAGYKGFHTETSNLGYGFEGKFIPVIVFEDNSVFKPLAELYNGSQKFKISYVEAGGYFELTRSDGYDNQLFRLFKAGQRVNGLVAAQVQEILDQIEFEAEQERLSAHSRQKFRDFTEITSDFYFYNIKTDNFSAAINNIDTAERKITLTYKETTTSAPKSVTIGYNYYPKGIKLTSAITYGAVNVDALDFGDIGTTTLKIVKAGNAGAGEMGYMHEAPYGYTLSTNRSLTLADYIVTVFPNFLQSSGVFSEKANEHSESLRNYIEDNTDYSTANRFLYFIYAPTYTTASSSFYVGTHNATGAVGNFRFDAVFTSLGNNKFALNDLTKQVIPAASPNILSRVSEYLDAVSPSEGVIAVPYDTGAGYRLRLINSTDSRIWVEYRWPSSTYWNLIFN